MSHNHTPDVSTVMTRDFWESHYRSADRMWDGNPPPQLVEQVADLAPGEALDVGCGEGAGAIWMAAQGWWVTGLDLSTVALDRAARRAAEAGGEVAARITWQQADLAAWDPAGRQFDLVSALFVHFSARERESVHRRLASAVRPGGTLLVVGHHPSDPETSAGRWNLPDLLFTADEVAAVLDPDDWQVLVAAAPERQARDPNGQPVTVRDAVLRARRRG